MHTKSNPQEHSTTAPATPADAAPETTATVEATPAKPAEPKPTTAKKPAAKKSAAGRSAAKPNTKSSRTAKPASKAPTATPAAKPAGSKLREGSTMWAVLQVLDKANEPMGAKAIYAQIAERKLAPGLKGKTPDQSVAAALAVAAKAGRYVERAAPGKFQLLKERS